MAAGAGAHPPGGQAAAGPVRWPRARGRQWRRAAVADDCALFSGPGPAADPGLWNDGNLTRGLCQHAGGQPPRHRGPRPARRGGADWREPGTAGAAPLRDARLLGAPRRHRQDLHRRRLAAHGRPGGDRGRARAHTGTHKEIIVTSTGEKIPPADLELAITGDPFFTQVFVVGEDRPFIAAVAVIERGEWQTMARRLGLDPEDPKSLNHSAAEREALEIGRASC